MNIAKLIKTKRTELGMTQQKLADLSGIPVSTIWHYEKGTYKPTLDVLFLIFNALNIEMVIDGIHFSGPEPFEDDLK